MIKNPFHPVLPRLIFLLGVAFFLLRSSHLTAQDREFRTGIPITVSLFSESVSLSSFRGLFKSPGWGIRIGTE